MQFKTVKGTKYLIGYHTQEFRALSESLSAPIRCKGKNAWLGVGYYFWTDESYAHFWGLDFKCATGAYDIYKADLNIEDCINSVFDMEGYFFLKEKIEETIEHFARVGKKLTLEAVHRFLADGFWREFGVTGIIYDDKPINSAKFERIHSEIPDLYYKKRIQVVLFGLENIRNFDVYLEEQNK